VGGAQKGEKGVFSNQISGRFQTSCFMTLRRWWSSHTNDVGKQCQFGLPDPLMSHAGCGEAPTAASDQLTQMASSAPRKTTSGECLTIPTHPGGCSVEPVQAPTDVHKLGIVDIFPRRPVLAPWWLLTDLQLTHRRHVKIRASHTFC
jgi:hypothetical protein